VPGPAGLEDVPLPASRARVLAQLRTLRAWVRIKRLIHRQQRTPRTGLRFRRAARRSSRRTRAGPGDDPDPDHDLHLAGHQAPFARCAAGLFSFPGRREGVITADGS
jgi:hypothetical protein